MNRFSRFSTIKIASKILIPLADMYERFAKEKPSFSQYEKLHTALHKQFFFKSVFQHFAIENGLEYARYFDDHVTAPPRELSAFWLSKPRPDRDSDTWPESVQKDCGLVLHAAEEAEIFLRNLALVFGDPGHPLPKQHKGKTKRGKPRDPECESACNIDPLMGKIGIQN